MTTDTPREQARQLLHSLGFSAHHTGYRLLIPAIVLYAQDSSQSLTKEIYPTLARQFGYGNPANIEHPMRYAIAEAHSHGDPAAWAALFPHQEKSPSNRAFIAMLAECLEGTTTFVSP